MELDYEHHFLAQVFTDPNICYESSVKAEDFQSPFCRSVWLAMQGALNKGLEIDITTVFQTNPELPPSKLSELSERVITAN